MNRIDEVENGLRLAFELEGEQQKRMNIEERMLHYHVPGMSIALIEDGEIAWSKGYGLVRAGEQKAVTPDTLFQAASVSKPVTALAAMALVQAGVLELDRDVNEVLKSWKVPDSEFAATEKVTLRRLLSHNAGLTVHGFPGYAQGAPVPELVQVLRGEPPANTPAVFVDVTPGSIWRYSGGGTTVAQLLMMEATGQPFAEILRQYVLEPLGMNASTYVQPLPEALWDQAAAAHQSSGEPYAGNWHTYPEQAAAGLWTTPEDLARYVTGLQKMFHGRSNTVLAQEMAREMLKVQFADWGIGPQLGGEGGMAWFSHGGSNAGFRCMMHGFLHNGQGFVMMTNGDNGGNLVAEAIRSAAAAYNWPEFLPVVKQTMAVPVEKLNSFAGSYVPDIAPDVRVDVEARDGFLFITASELMLQKAKLYAQSESEFFEVETGSEIRFSAENEAVGFTLTVQKMEFHAKKAG